MTNQFEGLNEQQLQAVTIDPDTPCIVVAAPGSGKTRVIVDRLVYLINEANFNPASIAVTTFTRKAADEMRMRAATKLDGKINAVRLGTIHSLCLNILRDEGLVNNQEIIKTWEIKKVISQTLEPFKDIETGYKWPLSWISRAKASCVTPEQAQTDGFFFNALMSLCGDEMQAFKLSHILNLCYGDYEAFKTAERKIDFADMLMQVEILLNSDERFRQRWQHKIQCVLVDEAQDTGSQSYRILRTLAAPENRIFVVGDPDQELYRWAGANPDENIYGFRGFYPEGQIALLETNYRSTRAIIEATNKVIQGNYINTLIDTLEYSEREETITLTHQIGGKSEFKKTVKPSDTAPEGLPVSHKIYEMPADEAQGVVDAIETQIESEGRNPGDFFVIYRTNAQSRNLEESLMRKKIPFVVMGGDDFFDRKQVKDILSYIRLASDLDNDEAFERVVNIASANYQYPTRRIGRKLMKDIEARTNIPNGKVSLYTAFMNIELSRFYQAARHDLVSLLTDIDIADSAAAAVMAVRKECYESYLIREEGIDEADAIEQGTFEILDELSEFATNFDSIQAMFDHIEWMQALRKRQSKDVDHAVVLTTIHKVKGLERPIVYGIGINEGLLPHAMSIGLGSNTEGMLPLDTNTGVEDERCAMYVLVSRAKEELHLSSITEYREHTLEPSRFLYEMGILSGMEALEGSL